MPLCLVAEKGRNYRISRNARWKDKSLGLISLTFAQKLKLSCVFIGGLENKLIVVLGSYTLVVRNYMRVLFLGEYYFMRVLELVNSSFGFPNL